MARLRRLSGNRRDTARHVHDGIPDLGDRTIRQRRPGPSGHDHQAVRDRHLRSHPRRVLEIRASHEPFVRRRFVSGERRPPLGGARRAELAQPCVPPDRASSRGMYQLERRHGLRLVAVPAHRDGLSAAERRRVGVCRPRRDEHPLVPGRQNRSAVSVRERGRRGHRFPLAYAVQRRQCKDFPGGLVSGKRLQPARHAGKCLGVGAGLLHLVLRRGTGHRRRLGGRRSLGPRDARRLVGQHLEVPPGSASVPPEAGPTGIVTPVAGGV